MQHKPVLLEEITASYRGKRLTRFIDGTVGAGGHALKILEEHPEIETYLAIDQDPEALVLAKEALQSFPQVRFHLGNFSKMEGIVDFQADGILLDLGVSSMQIDRAERGFSFLREGPLDMRMSPSDELTADQIVNTWTEEQLGEIFREYGEEKKWRRAAREIVMRRPLHTTMQLVAALDPLLRVQKQNKHPLTRIFQALRIAVNDELKAVQTALPALVRLLAPEGILAVITFHSLEDRIVKRFFQQLISDKMETSGLGGLFRDKKPEGTLLTRKPIAPSDDEVGANPRSRSAKVRLFQKYP